MFVRMFASSGCVLGLVCIETFGEAVDSRSGAELGYTYYLTSYTMFRIFPIFRKLSPATYVCTYVSV